MIDQLLTTPAIGVLERSLSFTEQRHNVILENLANVSTPGYVQKDVSVRDFQKSLADAVERQRQACNEPPLDPDSTDTVAFCPRSSRVQLQPQPVVKETPFHDRGVRSMEDLMGQLADNALAHNMAAQLLRNRYDILQKAIVMKV